jgi:hypothetical protein
MLHHTTIEALRAKQDMLQSDINHVKHVHQVTLQKNKL